MDPGNDEPFDRKPWRRLLEAESGAPTKNMDQRILAESRRALTPRVARWWLPASLAASLLLAILIVQWQLAVVPAPVSESDVLSAPAPIPADEAAPAAAVEAPPQRQVLPPAPAADMLLPKFALPAQESQRVRETATPATPPAASASVPVAQKPALASEQPAMAESAADVMAPAPAQADSSAVPGKLHALTQSSAEPRTAEQWYADIEALRATGRIKEADAELARFKSKYPGWLERHQLQNP